MAKRVLYDINDDEMRVIGRPASQGGKRRSPWLRALPIALCAVALILLLLLLVPGMGPGEPETTGVFEQQIEAPVKVTVEDVLQPLSSGYDAAAGPCVEFVDTTINDVRLSIYIPHNATPVLTVGNPDGEIRRDGVLAFQAADIRADNRKILGAFVLKGEPLAWGLSKKGFCAIIDGQVTVGVSENSPLFEEATEKDGYFFRQYPLVSDGTLCENELKGKSIRKAICDRAGEIFVAVSETDESMHDFAQALVDLGVDNAVYLVGSRYSFGWCRADLDTAPAFFGEDIHLPRYKNESYIVWK